MVHRVDGPIGAYRGFDDGRTRGSRRSTRELADATVLQSRYSLEKHAELGIELRAPVVITNTVDPAIFHPPERSEPLDGRRCASSRRAGRRTRVRAPTCSPGSTRNLDPIARDADVRRASRRSRSSGSGTSARSTRTGSRELLREHDVYLAGEPRRPVLERAPRGARVRAPRRLSRQRRAPGARRRRRGCRSASPEEVPDVLDAAGRGPRRLSARAIRVPSLAAVADAYLGVLGLATGVALESLPVQNYARRAVRSARFRLDRRLDRAAVSRAHDVLYESDAWTKPTWLGTQALKNPLDLWVYQEIMFETKPELIVETGTYRGGSALLPRVALRPHGSRRGRVDRRRADARRLPRASADHVSRRPLVDGSGRRRGGAGARRRAVRSSSSSTPTIRRRTSRRSSRHTRRSCRSAATSSSRTRTSGRSART